MSKSYLGVGELIYNNRLYDKINSFDSDFSFYTELSKEAGGAVLELCCGTGRLTIPIHNAGVDITGLDYTESMLEGAREKSKGLNIPFVQGDIRSFNLNKKFNLIFIPFNSFQHMYTLSDVEQAFECIQKHLAQGGLFAFDIFNPSIDLMVHWKGKRKDVNHCILEDGRSVLIQEIMNYDEQTQCNRTKWLFNIDGVEEIAQLDMRCFYPIEIEAYLKYNGFEIVEKYGDFDKSPFVSKSMKQIFVCRVR